MKKMLFLTFLIFTALMACKKTEVVSCGDTFELDKDQTVTICDIKIRLDSVQDSRCPESVVCIHAGEAIAKLTFTKGNEEVLKFLKVTGKTAKPDTVLVFDKKAILFSVSPYPNAQTPIAQKDYKLQMKVE